MLVCAGLCNHHCWFQNIASCQKVFPPPVSVLSHSPFSSPPARAPTKGLCVSIDVPVLAVSHQWDHTLCGLSGWLLSQHNLVKAHPCCSMNQYCISCYGWNMSLRVELPRFVPFIRWWTFGPCHWVIFEQCYQFLGGHRLFLLSSVAERGAAGSEGTSSQSFAELAGWLPRRLHVTFPPPARRGSSFSTSPPTLVLFYYSHLSSSTFLD